jgi:hypothetical protein
VYSLVTRLLTQDHSKLRNCKEATGGHDPTGCPLVQQSWSTHIETEYFILVCPDQRTSVDAPVVQPSTANQGPVMNRCQANACAWLHANSSTDQEHGYCLYIRKMNVLHWLF